MLNINLNQTSHSWDMLFLEPLVIKHGNGMQWDTAKLFLGKNIELQGWCSSKPCLIISGVSTNDHNKGVCVCAEGVWFAANCSLESNGYGLTLGYQWTHHFCWSVWVSFRVRPFIFVSISAWTMVLSSQIMMDIGTTINIDQDSTLDIKNGSE